jgi:phytol kinase
MSKDLVNVLILTAYFLLLFGGAEVLFYYFKWKAEHTRKVVHFGTGILTFLFPVMLSHHLWVLLLCSSFAILLMTSMKFNFLKSINGVDRITWGSLCFPLSVYLCFVAKVYFDEDLLFYLPMLILAISDPAAALIGKATGWRPYQVWGQTKTWAGSLAFFVSAFCLTFGFHFMLQHESLNDAFLLALSIGIFTSFTEAISTKGWDNLSIPMSVILIEFLFSKFF